MLDMLAPRLRAASDLEEDAAFEINDLFVTKYDAATAENKLGPHTDKSPWSFVVALNQGNNNSNNDKEAGAGKFEGGGTYILSSRQLHRPPAGGAVFFSGNNWHASVPITKGVRHLLAGFVEEVHDNNSSSSSRDNDGSTTHSAATTTTTPTKTDDFGEGMFFQYYDPAFDGHTAAVGFRSGDSIVALEVCYSGNEDGEEEEVSVPLLDGTTTTTTTTAASTVRLTDEQWVAAANSCEQLVPGQPTKMNVLR
jgi:hypothetical protein